MIKIVRTDSRNIDFVSLVRLLDADLGRRDGKDQDFYKHFNKIENLNNVIVAYLESEPVGCGALRYYKEKMVEIKRMFVKENKRGKGIASEILKSLEVWALELGYTSTILETGKRQPEAIRLYEKNNYLAIPNYGQYIGVDNSICMMKTL